MAVPAYRYTHRRGFCRALLSSAVAAAVSEGFPFPAGQTPVPYVIAHRGEHLRNPENSMAGIQAAVDIGVDFVELDVRTTADGRFVLMHDATVERTTGGKGLVAEMRWADLERLRLGPQITETVPAFEAALEVLRRSARAGLYLDAKQISPAAIARSLREHRMEERTVVYGAIPLLQELRQTGCRARVMPEARNAEVLRTLLSSLRPRVVAFDHRDWTPELIAMARASGTVEDLFVDRLGPNDTEAAWLEAIRMGATGIQTDHPARLLELRRKRETA